MSGIEGTIRNHKEEWVLGFLKGFLEATNNQIELMALLEGLRLVKEHNLFPVEINIDSKEVTHMLKFGNLHYNPIR